MFRAIFLGLTLAITGIVAEQALAIGQSGDESASYSVSIKGIPAGRMDIRAKVNGTSYAAAATIRSTGIVGALARYRFSASVVGQIKGAGFAPQKYSETSDTGRRSGTVEMFYRNGIPSRAVTSPPPALNPTSQGGTIDPMSGILAAFRDQTAATLCRENHVIYDGKRRTQLTLSSKSVDGTATVCTGTYTRLGGFKQARMDDGTEFPLIIKYTQSGDIYRVHTLTIQSTRGRAVFSRR